METTYRFRFLIYLAAFMLLMSVCFVYAEPVPENHLLFQVAPQHAAFLAPSVESPTFDRNALRAASPVVSFQIVGQLETPSHPSPWTLPSHPPHCNPAPTVECPSAVRRG